MQECNLTVTWVGPLFALVLSDATRIFLGAHLRINNWSNVDAPLHYLLVLQNQKSMHFFGRQTGRSKRMHEHSLALRGVTFGGRRITERGPFYLKVCRSIV